MEILILAIQWLSLGLLVFGCGLCASHFYREWAEAEKRRTPMPASVPPLAEQDIDERTAAG
jgi:hypothetical protein